MKPARVFVIGAGVVGTAAARTAAGTGADVTICDISLQRLTYLADVMPKNVKTLMSSEYNIREELKTCRPGDRLGADPRRQGSEARHTRHAPGDGAQAR